MHERLVVRLMVFCILLAGCNFMGSKQMLEPYTPTTAPIVIEPSPTPQPVKTEVINEGKTQIPSPTYKVDIVPSPTTQLIIVPSPTTFPAIWYTVQPGTPLAMFNLPHAEAGCSWLGVGGQVFGEDTAPVLGLNILVGGTLDGYKVGSLGTTGMETNIGEGGYEITLGDHPVDSKGTLWIEVVDNIGNPLSVKIPFDTVNDCSKNFILINFNRFVPEKPIGSGGSAFLPLISNPAEPTLTPSP